MILSAISTAVLAKLLADQGTNSFWDATSIQTDCNWLYIDTAESTRCLKKRDTSTNTVVDTARYVIPIAGSVGKIIGLVAVEYDKKPIPFYSVAQLDAMFDDWRNLDSADTPIGCTYDVGDEDVAITLVPKSGAVAELAMSFIYIPVELAVGDTPVHPFDDGRILIDGLMSMQLSKPGGGRDLDRADFYFGQFMSKIMNLTTRHKGFGVRGLKSIEDVSSRVGGNVRLPDHYPHYEF